MDNISKYANSSCKTCIYSIECPTFADDAIHSACKDCHNYNAAGPASGFLNCRCFETAPDTDICPYYEGVKDD